MKASIKFREDQKPLLRAKVPLSILGLPFHSGIVAGESKELTLNLGTFFESGPSVKLAYRPNDAWNPFSVIVKTGTGHFGSPSAASPLLMSAEFSLIGRGSNHNPRFMLHVKPRLGDFSIRKSQSSIVSFDAEPPSVSVPNGIDSPPNGEDNGSEDVVSRLMIAGSFCGKRISLIPTVTPTASAIAGLLSGMEIAARTAVPVRGRAVVNFRWGVRVLADIEPRNLAVNPTAGFSFKKIPFMVMNKIGIEHVDGSDQSSVPAPKPKSLSPLETPDIAETCCTVKRQLETLQAENGLLRKAMEDLRREFALAASSNPAILDRSGSRKTDRWSSEFSGGFGSKLGEADASEDSKKA